MTLNNRRNKIYSMHPIDKTRIDQMNFVLMAPGRKTQEGVPSSPQWDGFLKVLNTSDLEFLSLDGVENPDKNGRKI